MRTCSAVVSASGTGGCPQEILDPHVAAQLNAQDIFLSFQEDVLAEESTRERVVLEPRLLTPTTQGAIQDLMVPLLLQDMYQALLSNLSEVAVGL